MWRALVCGVAFLGGLVSTTGLADAAHRDAPCGIPGARVVAKTRVARVVLDNHVTYYGCLNHHRAVEMGTRTPPGYGGASWGEIHNITLAGRYVGFTEWAQDHNFLEYYVMVTDLRTRRSKVALPTGTAPPDQRSYQTGFGPTTGLVLKDDGAVAWIAQDIYAEPTTYEVHKADRDGKQVLDAGPDVDPQSLRLTGSRLSWIKNGQPASAVLR
jgi:hypothetical protein